MSNEKRNMELMQSLDDAWNAQDWDTFEKRHKHDTVVRWPAQPPTHGIKDHRAEGCSCSRPSPTNTSTTGRTRSSSPMATGHAPSRVSGER